MKNFFEKEWVFFYCMALTIIDKCHVQFLENDYTKKIISIEDCAVDAYGPFNKLLKGIFKKKSKKMIWAEIIKKASSYHMNSEYLKELWKSYDQEKNVFTVKVDLEKLKTAIYL